MKAFAFFGGGVSTLDHSACSASLIPSPNRVVCTACLRVSGARVHVSLAAPFPGPLLSLHGSDYPWPFLKGTSSSLTFAEGQCELKKGTDSLIRSPSPTPSKSGLQVETSIGGRKKMYEVVINF